MEIPIDFNNATPLAFVFLVIFLLVRYFIEKDKKNSAFTENIALQAMDRSEKATKETQRIAQEATTAMREMITAMKNGDEVIVNGFKEVNSNQKEITKEVTKEIGNARDKIVDGQKEIMKAQADHDDSASKRHGELAAKHEQR